MSGIPFRGVGRLFLFVLAVAASGCTLHPGGAAERIAADAAWEKSYIQTSHFVLTSWHRFSKPGEPLTVYIEGDGKAWLSRSRLSEDPTPLDTLVADLARGDPSANVAYLARPGQYAASGSALCDAAYWAGRRFSEEVITAVDESVDRLRQKAKATKIHLVGYSGGAAVAVLIAARRYDVIGVRTIAGNLDHKALNEYHRVDALSGSLNPIDYASDVSRIPMRHFVGTKDRVVPAFIVQSFARRTGDLSCRSVTEVEGATHSTGWREKWVSLLLDPLLAAPGRMVD
jgi:hypothetical protein